MERTRVALIYVLLLLPLAQPQSSSLVCIKSTDDKSGQVCAYQLNSGETDKAINDVKGELNRLRQQVEALQTSESSERGFKGDKGDMGVNGSIPQELTDRIDNVTRECEAKLVNVTSTHEQMQEKLATLAFNECTMMTDDCDTTFATCTDTVGSFMCTCKAGYTGAGTTGMCTNIDECTTGADNCDDTLATCTDNDGNFTCACITGYAGDGTTGNCTDINECTMMTDDCDTTFATCTDTVGSFMCTCKAGYTGAGTTGMCTNIDECTTGADNCDDTLATCTDNDGNFTCACITGYAGDGTTGNCMGFRNCHDIAQEGFNQSGLYDVFINGITVTVYCDLLTDGTIWLVIQRRQNGREEFYRNWTEYERGFGNKSGEFWLGLKNIHSLTTSLSYELRVDLEDWGGNTVYAVYSVFSVGNASSNYRLNIGGYSGNASNSMTYHNNKPFSTKDRDNDACGCHCAEDFHGAWWYRDCANSNLNGQYYGDGRRSTYGVWWYHWKSSWLSLKRAEMKIRPI